MMLVDFESLPKVARESMNQYHKEEVDIINQLYRACKEGNTEEIDRALAVFLDHIEEHFSHEEELMRKVNFFAYPMHKAEHDSVRAHISQLYRDWGKDKNPQSILKFLEEFFINWLFSHISTMDTVTAQHVGEGV